MSAKWERDSEASKGTLTFEIDVETAKKGIDQAFKRTQKRITVPGFRKGHVPRQLFNQMYGEEALYQDALNIVLPKAYEDAVKETGIEPVDQPQIDVKSLEKGQPWVLTAEVAVKPEVKLGDYKGMEVPAQDTTVSDKEVEDELESKRQQQAELVLKEDQPAENGDTVVIDYVGSVDGEKFDGGSADNYSLELGSGAFIPGFEDQLVGHKSGEDVEVKVTFPEEYHAQDLAGKEAVFEVKLHEVKEKQLPEMDDEFVKLVLQNDEPLPNERKETSDKDQVFTPEERNTIRRMLELHDDPHTMGYVMGRIARNVCERQGYQTGYAICFAEFEGRDEVVEAIANLYERMAKQAPMQRGVSKDCAMVDVETKDRRTYSMLITADKMAYYAACELLFGPESPLPEEARARIFINVIELAK